MSGLPPQTSPTHAMAPDPSLKRLVQEQYRTIGIDKSGKFVGKERFTSKLISYYGKTKGAQGLDRGSWKEKLKEIRRLVDA